MADSDQTIRTVAKLQACGLVAHGVLCLLGDPLNVIWGSKYDKACKSAEFNSKLLGMILIALGGNMGFQSQSASIADIKLAFTVGTVTSCLGVWAMLLEPKYEGLSMSLTALSTPLYAGMNAWVAFFA